MAVYGGQVQAINMAPDTRASVAAARELALTQGQGIAGMVQQVGDYFKQQGEKKKLIKQSDVQIDAALKLFPEMASVLQPYKDQIRDENVPLDERAFMASQTSDYINNALNMMKTQTSMGIARQREARMAASAGGGAPAGGDSGGGGGFSYLN